MGQELGSWFNDTFGEGIQHPGSNMFLPIKKDLDVLERLYRRWHLRFGVLFEAGRPAAELEAVQIGRMGRMRGMRVGISVPPA